jgi:hypothetical protein
MKGKMVTCHSEGSHRFAGRLLTGVQKRGRQGRSVLRYGYEALVAPHNGLRDLSRLSVV